MSSGVSQGFDLTIIGPGRLGTSIARASKTAGLEVLVRGRDIRPGDIEARIALICVPDSSIAEAAAAIAATKARPAFIGHTSGATALSALDMALATEGEFLFHPLQTFPQPDDTLEGVPVATWGTSERAGGTAEGLARALGAIPFTLPEQGQAAYHAAASIASNFLVTLEESASGLLETAGVDSPRRMLAPLLRTTLENWIEQGDRALTGPIVRGDEETVVAHRQALIEVGPDLIPLYDALAERTRDLARGLRTANEESSDADPG